MYMEKYEFWFVVGSQFLYGPEVLDIVAERAAEMAEKMNESGLLPCKVVYKVTAKTPEEITQVVKEANFDDNCAGIITWMHTFSPSKMWLNGLKELQKPYCHFATQYNRDIPNEEIDMDFMNLNQAAHGDREHGFIAARLRTPRKVIMGYWQDEKVLTELGKWMRSAVGAAFSKKLKVMRFGDNMRNVAVTEGDKVGVQEVLGWQVNTWPVGTLVEYINAVTEAEVDALMEDLGDLTPSFWFRNRSNPQNVYQWSEDGTEQTAIQLTEATEGAQSKNASQEGFEVIKANQLRRSGTIFAECQNKRLDQRPKTKNKIYNKEWQNKDVAILCVADGLNPSLCSCSHSAHPFKKKLVKIPETDKIFAYWAHFGPIGKYSVMLFIRHIRTYLWKCLNVECANYSTVIPSIFAAFVLNSVIISS